MEMKTARRRRTTSKKGASKTGTPTWKQAAQKEEEGAKKRIGLPPLAVMDKTELPTVSQLRDIIPKHCFQRSSLHSLALVVRDGLIIFALGYIAWHYLPTIPVDNSWSTWATWFFSWSMYWYWQGAAMTGWWVLAHECGHRGFSESTLLCDVVGFILHSFLLVPYFSWQYSHAKHHAKTSHLSDGETHIASIKKDSTRDRWMHAVLGDDAFAVVEILLLLTIGWPIYLFTGITGARRDPEGKPLETGKLRDHFRPSSALFPKTGAWDARVMASNAGLVLNLYAIYAIAEYSGQPLKVAMMYFPAYLWVNMWLVLYTWLHHVSTEVPQLGDGEWSWVRGALCTIDRPYPFPIDWMHHHIGSTHVAHHLFSNMPCYHAVEATAALKKFLEPKGLYNYDPRGIIRATWETAHDCHYVDSEEGVQMWKKWKTDESDCY
jgi:fatty acid desaturase